MRSENDTIKISWMSPKDLKEMDDQPRQIYKEHVQELVESMRAEGFKKEEFLRVAKLKKDHLNGKGTLFKANDLVVYDGNHRLAAALKAVDTVAVQVIEMDYETAWLEGAKTNLQQQQYTPLEEARIVATMIERYKISQREAARKLLINEATVRYMLKLLEAHPEIQEMVEKEELASYQASIISELPMELQKYMAKRLKSSPNKFARDSIKDIVKSVLAYPIKQDKELYLKSLMDEVEGINKKHKDSIFGGKFDKNIQKEHVQKRRSDVAINLEVDNVLKIEKAVSLTLKEVLTHLTREGVVLDRLADDLKKSNRVKKLKKIVKENKYMIGKIEKYYKEFTF
jgi:hypothetical protein